MTVAMLMENVFLSADRIFKKNLIRKITPLKLDIQEKVPSDIEIASKQIPKPVAELASEIGVSPAELELYGKYKAKVQLSILERLSHRKNGKYIVVAGISPTPLGEGKSQSFNSQTPAKSKSNRQVHHDSGFGTSTRCSSWQGRICMCSTALARSYFRQ